MYLCFDLLYGIDHEEGEGERRPRQFSQQRLAALSRQLTSRGRTPHHSPPTS